MKNRQILLAFLFLLTFFRASATDVLARRVDLFFEKKPLKTALDEVAKQANFEWSYNPKIIDENRRVSLSVQNWTVREALFEMLGDGFEFKSSGNFLILKKEKPSKTEFSGTLRDPKTGERLANATVFDKKTLRATTTDSSGFYRLKVKKRSEIVVTKLGYRDTVLQVEPGAPRFQKIELVQNFPLPDTAMKAKSKGQKAKEIATELEYFFAATLDRWHEMNLVDTFRRPFQISFLPKMGTNHVLDAKVENQFSINILAGQSAGVDGLELAGLGNFTKKNVRGGQFAGLFNYVDGDTKGIAGAGLVNRTGGELTGAQLAGLVNSAKKTRKVGFQAAGLANFSGRESKFSGGQAAGLFNISDELRGIQAAGLFNFSKKTKGGQVGVFNFSQKMRGLQIGVFNNANELKGVQIGLLNRAGGRVLPFFNWRFHQK